MSNLNELQHRLFQSVKGKLPSHLSLPEELADLLKISVDSAYRRLRGEKPISLIEFKVICERYQLSADQLLHLENESVLFTAPGLHDQSPDFLIYLRSMLQQFEFFSSFQNQQMLYLCKDVPFWYFFLFPEIAAFKIFFWSKTINNQSALHHKQFSFAEYSFTECYELGQLILQKHNQMHSVELWNIESIHSTINQLSYYKDAGVFKTDEDFVRVCESFVQLINHLQIQTESGQKFMPAMVSKRQGKIDFYVNELILGNNTILLQLDEQRIAMITYNILNYLTCNDERFVNKAFDAYYNLLNRSAFISGTGEKERSKFFNKLREKVATLQRK